VVFDYRSELDDDARRCRAPTNAGRSIPDIETLNEVARARRELPATPGVAPGAEDVADPLALLIYTSAAPAPPRARLYPQTNVAKMWNRSTKNWFGPKRGVDQP